MTAVSAPTTDPGVAGSDASWALKSPDPRGQEPARKPALARSRCRPRGLAAEGWTITAAELGALSPYLRGHISRFGAYATDELGRHSGAFNPVLEEVDFTTPVRRLSWSPGTPAALSG